MLLRAVSMQELRLNFRDNFSGKKRLTERWIAPVRWRASVFENPTCREHEIRKPCRTPVWNQNREEGVYFGVNWRVVLAQHAAERSAVRVHREMGCGLSGLATVAATAPFVGMIGTVLGIINSFRGFDGERSAIMAAIAQGLSDSMMPTALGVAASITALWGYRYFSTRLADFNSEIRNAIQGFVQLFFA